MLKQAGAEQARVLDRPAIAYKSFFFVYECARCCQSWTQPLASLEKFVCHCKSPNASVVCKLQIRGPSEGKATEGRGQERPAEPPREARAYVCKCKLQGNARIADLNSCG